MSVRTVVPPAASTPGAAARGRRPLPVRVHMSWVLMALFVAWALAAGALPMLYLGVPSHAYGTTVAVIAAGVLVSVAAHELAHLAVARGLGRGAPRVTLFLFGSMAELGQEPDDPLSELLIALSGPLVSVVLSLVVAQGAAQAVLNGWPQSAGVALLYVATFNLVLAAFNLMPAYPLDGGRVVRAAVWAITGDLDHATSVACRVAEAIAWLMMLGGAVALFAVDLVSGLWWILVGAVLRGAAAATLKDLAARRHFSGHKVAELMARALETAPADLTLDRFVDERLLASRHAVYPVVDGGRFVGVISPEQVLATPRVRWATTTVGETCAAAAETAVAGPDDDAADVLRRMHALDVERMPVVRGDTVIGIVSLRDLIGSFDLWRRLRPQAV